MDIAALEKTLAENAASNLHNRDLLDTDELLEDEEDESSEVNDGLSEEKLQDDVYSLDIPVTVKLEHVIPIQDQSGNCSNRGHTAQSGYLQLQFGDTATDDSSTNNGLIGDEISCQNPLTISFNNAILQSDTARDGTNSEGMQIELDPTNSLASNIKHSYCANCKTPRDNFSKKFSELLPMEYFNPSTGDYGEIEIVEALCEVFKIRWTCENFTQLCQKENLELCNECSTLLVQLYRFYTQFAALTVKNKSFLSTVVSFHKDLSNVEDPAVQNNQSESDSDNYADAEDTFQGDEENEHNIRRYSTSAAVEEYDDEDPTEPKESNIPLKKRVSSKPVRKYTARATSKRLTTILRRLNPPLKKPTIKTDMICEPLSCKDCDKDFKFPIQLRIHLNSPAHKDKLKELKIEVETDSDYDPSEGKEERVSVKKLRKDGSVAAKRGRKKKIIADISTKKRSNERKKNKTCPMCDKSFARSKDLKRHLNTHEKKKAKGNPTIECERCNKKFDTEGGLKIHFAAHVRDDNKHICKDCGKKFRKLEALEHHEKVDHGGFKPHCCPHCAKCFRLKDKLKLHVMSIHEKRNPFPCQKCEKAFRTKYHLKIHDVAVHVQGGDSVLGCSQCKRKFTDREALEKHVIIHQQEKPYICDKCNKGFQTSARLKLHEKSHLEVPTCLCPVCGRAYKHIRDLKLHEVSHQDESTFRFGCGDCGKKFYRIDLLRVHQSNEKHFSPDVIGPSPALRDKALGTRESTFYDLPNTYPSYGDDDDNDEFESGEDSILPTPKPKKRRVTKPRQRKIQMSSVGDNVLPSNLQAHSNVPVIYYQSSMTHFEDHQGPSRDTTAFIQRTEPNINFNFNPRDTTRPTLLHNSHQQPSHTHSHPNTNPAHHQIQIPLVNAHSHNQFSNYVIREIGNDRNIVQGAEQIGFDVISSFINNLG